MLNKVILIGKLIGEPELRYFKNGNIITILKLLTNDTWGEVKDTQLHRIILSGKILNFKKGMVVFVEGKIRTRKWMGEIKYNYITEIFSNNIKVIKNNVNFGDENINTNNNEYNTDELTRITSSENINENKKDISDNINSNSTKKSYYENEEDDTYNYNEENFNTDTD